MKSILYLALIIGLLTVSCAPKETITVNPNATQEAQQLLQFLYDIQGQYTLTGQHNFIATGSKYTDLMEEMTGKYPIVWGSDFSFCYDGEQPMRFLHCGPLNLTDPGSVNYRNPGDVEFFSNLTAEEARQQMVDNAIQKYSEGYIITLMWHGCPPELGDCCDGQKIWAMENRPTPEEWNELTTEGTPKNTAWKEQADTIAGYLKQLQDAGVPVLWRPYHEMNGVWFWWCNQKGEDGFKKLWIMMYEYFVNHHQLNNLIWVWNTNAPRDIPGDEAFAYVDFWPGIEYVDVLAADVYRADWKQSHHDDLITLGQGKPIALGEVGGVPTPEVLTDQPNWTWYMPWGNLVLFSPEEVIQELFEFEQILTKDEVVRDAAGNYSVRLN